MRRWRRDAERRAITFRARAAEIVRKIVPEKLRDRIDGLVEGLRQSGERAAAPETVQPPERKVAEDPQALRRARTRALIRHARAAAVIVPVRVGEADSTTLPVPVEPVLHTIAVVPEAVQKSPLVKPVKAGVGVAQVPSPRQ